MFIIALFLAGGPVSYAAVIAFLAVVIGISGISPRLVVRGLRPVLFIIAFTAVLNLFYTPSATGEYLWQWGFLHISWEGVKVAFFMVLRLSLIHISARRGRGHRRHHRRGQLRPQPQASTL